MLPLSTGWPHNGILTNENPLCHLQQLTKGVFSLLLYEKKTLTSKMVKVLEKITPKLLLSLIPKFTSMKVDNTIMTR